MIMDLRNVLNILDLPNDVWTVSFLSVLRENFALWPKDRIYEWYTQNGFLKIYQQNRDHLRLKL